MEHTYFVTGSALPALSALADCWYATDARMHTTMENCASMEAWCDQASTLMATVASLQATPSTVNCVAETALLVPHALNEMPMAKTHDNNKGTSVVIVMSGSDSASGVWTKSRRDWNSPDT